MGFSALQGEFQGLVFLVNFLVLCWMTLHDTEEIKL